VVDDTCFARCVGLEGPDLFVGRQRQAARPVVLPHGKMLLRRDCHLRVV
jgi:hypothetical protein